MNTQDLINQALSNPEDFVLSALGQKSDWLAFAEGNGVEVQVNIWGNKFNIDRTRATFWDGSRRISRAVAESLIRGA
jgi:hypothetical protein